MDSPNRYTGKDNVIAPLKQATESQHHIINLLRQSLPSIPPSLLWNGPPGLRFTSVVLIKKLPLPPSLSPAIFFNEIDLDNPETRLK